MRKIWRLDVAYFWDERPFGANSSTDSVSYVYLKKDRIYDSEKEWELSGGERIYAMIMV